MPAFADLDIGVPRPRVLIPRVLRSVRETGRMSNRAAVSARAMLIALPMTVLAIPEAPLWSRLSAAALAIVGAAMDPSANKKMTGVRAATPLIFVVA